MDTTIRDTEAELTRVGQSLHTYESVGLGFENIVREYTQLQDDIENKRWAMRELKLSLDSSWLDSSIKINDFIMLINTYTGFPRVLKVLKSP